jgi:hypothetical protein
MHGQPHEAALAADRQLQEEVEKPSTALDRVEDRVRVFLESPVTYQPDAPRPFAHKRAPVREKDERPWNFQTLDPRNRAITRRAWQIDVFHILRCRPDNRFRRRRGHVRPE